MMALTRDEKSALETMGFDTYYAFNFFAFDMPRERARKACRSLRDKGLAYFAKGLFTDDGEMAGSGYGPTSSGVEVNRAILAFSWKPYCDCWKYPCEPIWKDPHEIMRRGE